MDWKIPATILILAFVVGLGVLPIFSPDFGSSISSHFGSLDGAASAFFQKTTTYEENVAFSMSAKAFPSVKTTTPTTVFVTSGSKYAITLDGKNMSLKGPLTLKEFIGNVDFASGKISGNANGIVSDSFDLSGKSAIDISTQNFDDLLVTGLTIAEVDLNDGVLDTTKPQTMKATISSGAKIYGFKGTMDYQNSTATIAGTASMIKTNGLTLGIDQIK